MKLSDDYMNSGELIQKLSQIMQEALNNKTVTMDFYVDLQKAVLSLMDSRDKELTLLEGCDDEII